MLSFLFIIIVDDFVVFIIIILIIKFLTIDVTNAFIYEIGKQIIYNIYNSKIIHKKKY